MPESPDDTSFICVEPELPLAISTAAAEEAIRIRPDNATTGEYEAAGLRKRFWPRGATLSVRFVDLPDPALVEVVMDAADAWLDGSGLGFNVVAGGDADIRITFEGAGNWSLLGTEAALESAGAPTMCLSELTRPVSNTRVLRVVRHEFGHALGLVHEHSAPTAGIRWNREAVYTALCPPAGPWSRETVDRQIFLRYERSCTNHTAFDPGSIMLYPIPSAWTTDGRGQELPGHDLSPVDRRFIRQVYRRPGAFRIRSGDPDREDRRADA